MGAMMRFIYSPFTLHPRAPVFWCSAIFLIIGWGSRAFPQAQPLPPGGDWLGTISVPCTTLERWASDHEIERIDLLKIDVEGSELRVLDGAKGLLQKGAITFVYLEVKALTHHESHGPGVSLIDVAAALEPFDYRLMVLQTDFVNLDSFYTNFNALFFSVRKPA